MVVASNLGALVYKYSKQNLGWVSSWFARVNTNYWLKYRLCRKKIVRLLKPIACAIILRE